MVGSASTFSRSRRTCTVTVDWSPKDHPHTFWSSSSRVNAWPGCDSRKRSRSNSRAVSDEPARRPGCGVLGRVDDQVAVGDGAADAAAGPLAGAPQHGVDPQHELARAERLGHVVVGARSSPTTRSVSEPSAVSMITGIVAAGAQPLGTPRGRRCPGSIRSSTTRSAGLVAQHRERASRRRAVSLDLVPGRPQVGHHDLAHGEVVIDHQHVASPSPPRAAARRLVATAPSDHTHDDQCDHHRPAEPVVAVEQGGVVRSGAEPAELGDAEQR